jgi:hypothetical protein
LLVFRCYDRITGNLSQPNAIICGVLCEAESFRTLKDWQVLRLLNELAGTVKPSADTDAEPTAAPAGKIEILTKAEALLREDLPSLDLPFRQPELELLGIVVGIGQTTLLPTSTS